MQCALVIEFVVSAIGLFLVPSPPVCPQANVVKRAITSHDLVWAVGVVNYGSLFISDNTGLGY
jgi:hypothetical protein